jgi:hypothetical protein
MVKALVLTADDLSSSNWNLYVRGEVPIFDLIKSPETRKEVEIADNVVYLSPSGNVIVIKSRHKELEVAPSV